MRIRARSQKQLGSNSELHHIFSPFLISTPFSMLILIFPFFSQDSSTSPSYMVENLVTDSSWISVEVPRKGVIQVPISHGWTIIGTITWVRFLPLGHLWMVNRRQIFLNKYCNFSSKHVDGATKTVQKGWQIVWLGSSCFVTTYIYRECRTAQWKKWL